MITLVLGGARSGKSEYAEALASARPAPVVYVATGDPSGDDDFAARVAAHRERRAAEWATIESGPALAAAVRSQGAATLLIDSLGTWLASLPQFSADVAELCAALVEYDGDVIVVSEEVGLGVHPSTDSGRRFRDALGSLNRAVAEVAGDVFLVVAGRALPLQPATSFVPRLP
ncbi:MAG TPA: bifunctional adenosylcobinamide kinase/adenosylcobinamide-phosphate guanylyltransferase [Acidimicrobiales bacterium]|nr:bifunctional adenosylcobinamide kinase/adenosylcobinamide-phosphate guanylyltransferase [Acidimicrobiales bacterium]